VPHDDLRVIVVVPEMALSTEKARGALPSQFSREDAVFNLQHCAMLVAGLQSGDLNLITRSLDDRMHQPYRSRLAPGLPELLAPREIDGLLGVVLSGAGPSVVALAHRNFDRIGRELSSVFEAHGIAAEALQLDIDREGTVITGN
jgi:homoserine kinase